MIEELTPPIREIIEKAQRMISGHFETSAILKHRFNLYNADTKHE